MHRGHGAETVFRFREQVGGRVGSPSLAGRSDGLGKIGVLVGLKSAGDQAELEALGKQLAMHIAAAKPDAVSIERLDPETVARERAIYADQARASGKPENIVEKMVEGRVRKFLAEVSLVDQPFVKDGDIKVGKLLADAGLSCRGFVRFEVGEGIEVEEQDFAAEVAAQVKGSD